MILKSPVKKTDKDAQIILAATEEFLSKGLDAASMHNIAEKAEVSKRTLYKYYPSKEELYNALINVILNKIERTYEFNYTTDKSVKKQIERVVDAKIELTLNEDFLKINKIVLGELLKGRMPNDEQMSRLNKSESNFVTWIEKSQENNLITSKISAYEIAEQFHSILKGQIYWPVLLGLKSKNELDINKVKETVINFFISSFTHN